MARELPHGYKTLEASRARARGQLAYGEAPGELRLGLSTKIPSLKNQGLVILSSWAVQLTTRSQI